MDVKSARGKDRMSIVYIINVIILSYGAINYIHGLENRLELMCKAAVGSKLKLAPAALQNDSLHTVRDLRKKLSTSKDDDDK